MISLEIYSKSTEYEVLVYLLHIQLGQIVYFWWTHYPWECLRNVCYSKICVRTVKFCFSPCNGELCYPSSKCRYPSRSDGCIDAASGCEMLANFIWWFLGEEETMCLVAQKVHYFTRHVTCMCWTWQLCEQPSLIFWRFQVQIKVQKFVVT